VLKYLKLFEQFINEKKPTGAPEFYHSDAPDANGRFKDLSIKDLAAWLIKTRKKDVKKISGSLTQQIVFNRKSDPKYAEKMEKTRKEVYKQLGREDLLKEALLEKGYNMDDIHDLIAFHRFNKDFRKLSTKDKEWVENDAKERGFFESADITIGGKEYKLIQKGSKITLTNTKLSADKFIFRNEKEFKEWADDQVEPIGGTQSSHFGISESADVESDLHKIYAAVNTDTGHEWAKEEGGKAYKVITPKDISKLELDPSIPILNYNMAVTEDLVKKFPKMKNFIYNPNETIQVSNSKKDFHERLGDDPNIPKTAYNEKGALEIGFPLIAKPKTGHSGKGIKIFKTKDEFLKEDKSKYDLFSQFIDKKSEHRIINFKGKPMVWMERTPLNEKAKKGDGNASEEMRFKYLKKDPSGLPNNFAKTNKAFCEKFKEIPLICFDIMEDQKGHVYIIESNTMTGMPFNISLELYEKLFEDYYKRPMSNKSKNEMKLLSEGLIKRTLSRDSDTKWDIES
jgi:glutathione synthase/RimK-type ligase-like ATP-grasp enzyme